MMRGSTAITRTALVTGGARRIGRAIVEDLADHGWAVAIHSYCSQDEARSLAGAIIARGGRAAVVATDLAGPDCAAALLSEARAAVGPIGCLVNNAAMFEDDSFATMDAAGLDHHLKINLTTPLLVAQAFAAGLGEAEHGLIVNMIDQRVWKPTPQHFSYSVAKAGLWAATRTMAQALAPRVRVVGIGPGPTLPSARQSEADFHRQSQALLLGAGPELGEFGRTVRFLAETPSITGQMIALDGGQHLAWQTPDVLDVNE